MSDEPVVRCCVCGEPLEPPYNTIHGRAYCARHFALVDKPHPGFWWASVIQLVTIALFAGGMALLGPLLGPLNGAGLIVVGVVMALVPSLLWIGFFYRQDRLEPEPKHKIAAVFLAALVLTDVASRWLIDGVFRVRDWAPATTLTSVLASMLVLGPAYLLVVYIAVRVMVYASEEFDERMDGIVYGTVAGLGVAAMLNLRFVLDNGGVALGPGAVGVVTTAMAVASFGGLLGYFMAEAKFEHKPAWWVPMGYALAALLSGLFSWLIGEVSAAGLGVQYWRSLLLGLIVALGAFFLLVTLMRRTTEVTLRSTGRSR
jgi:RsiW-degrading membrane proteinase PrsW (M82 family)